MQNCKTVNSKTVNSQTVNSSQYHQPRAVLLNQFKKSKQFQMRQHMFHQLLCKEDLTCVADGAVEVEEKALLAAPPHLFKEFVNSIEQFKTVSRKSTQSSLSKELKALVFNLDSGSEVHLLTLQDAIKLFGERRISNLRVIGVNGSSRAEFMGKLIIRVQDPGTGEVYLLDLGPAHGMRELPDNLLSVALLIRSGAVVHFEQGSSC